MKKIFLTGSIEEFEKFVNREDIKILQVDVKGCEQSIVFQQSFIGIVYYQLLDKLPF